MQQGTKGNPSPQQGAAMAGIPALAMARKRRNKYGNIRCELDGFSFDSKAEMRHYCELRIREKAGEICKISVHPKYEVKINGILVCEVVMDFAYLDRVGCPHVIDVKCKYNALSKLKRRLFEASTGLKVEIV